MSTSTEQQTAPRAPAQPDAPAVTEAFAPAGAGPADLPERGIRAEHIQDAHRDVLLAVQRALAANWDSDRPRIAVIEHNGIATVYVSTAHSLDPTVRVDVRGAVRAALAPYIRLAPFTNVVFLRRGRP